MSVKVAIAQFNAVVGDLAGNVSRIVDQAALAHELGAQVLLTPELALTGYPPEDLLLRSVFGEQVDHALVDLAQRLAAFSDLHAVVGHPAQREGYRFNAASVLCNGQRLGCYYKHDLPNYDVFDEQRYFTPDHRPLVFEVGGLRFGVNICEDTWYGYAPEAAQAAGAQILLVLNASPYHLDKQRQRLETLRRNVTRNGIAAVYANLVGGQDELVFDGASFALDAHGHLRMQAGQFVEQLAMVSVDAAGIVQGEVQPDLPPDAQIYQALVTGVRDYVEKNRFPGVFIGLSGGVDSALTLAVAVDALGAQRVHTVMMPSAFTAAMSLEDAQTMAERLGVRHDCLSIASMVEAFETVLLPSFANRPRDAAEENLQARVRGTLLMALSNKLGGIVLTTGNKSEMATGYCTLYGDMAGGFAVLKDVTKTQVYALCRYRNQISDVIPQRILTRAPSAELRPNQTDQDTLPPYEILDDILQRYMETNASVADLIAAGFDAAQVRQVVSLIKANEYKRRQAPIGIRVTHKAFGRDWRYPITSRFSQ